MALTASPSGCVRTQDSKAGRLVLLFIATIFVLAIALQFVRKVNVYGTASRSGRLAKQLPLQAGEWQSIEAPLGETELMKERTEVLLNFDDYVYRRYTSHGREFAVYVAHWSPGRMPTRLVALHTPDRCWIEAGWRCVAAEFNVSVTKQAPPAAQSRIFDPPQIEGRTYVWFWMSVDGKAYNFGNRLNTIPSPLRWITQIVREGFEESGEQVFVRVTSLRPLDELKGDSGFETVMAAVKKVLVTPQPSAASKTG